MEQKPSRNKSDYNRCLVLYRMFAKFHRMNPLWSSSLAFINFFASFETQEDLEEAIDKRIAEEEKFNQAIGHLLSEVMAVIKRNKKKD